MDRRLARALGGQDTRRRYHQLLDQEQLHGVAREPASGGTLHAPRSRHAEIRHHRGRPDYLDQAVDRFGSPPPDWRGDLRVRMSRGELRRDARHARRRASRREEGVRVRVPAIAILAVASAAAQTPDLQGVYVNNDATPLERPKALEGRAFLTDAEVA